MAYIKSLQTSFKLLPTEMIHTVHKNTEIAELEYDHFLFIQFFKYLCSIRYLWDTIKLKPDVFNNSETEL